jgi:hypothetical protein
MSEHIWVTAHRLTYALPIAALVLLAATVAAACSNGSGTGY